MKTPFKKILAPAVVATALLLSGCGGDTDAASQEGADTGQSQPAGEEAAPEEAADAESSAPLTTEQLETVVENLNVDGTSFQVQTIAAGDQAAAQDAIGAAKIEPAECAAVVSAGMASQNAGRDVVMGTAEAGASVALQSGDAISDEFDGFKEQFDACKDMTIETGGVKVEATMEQFDVDIDDAVGLTTNMDTNGQKLSQTSVYAVDDNVMVTASVMTGEADAQQKLAADIVKAATEELDKTN